MSTSTKYLIYKVTAPNGKIYIGLTSKSLAERRAKHFDTAYWVNPNGYFQKALKKYNDNLVWEILEQNLSKEEAIEKEILYIQTFNSNNINFGYNRTLGGEFPCMEAFKKVHNSFKTELRRELHAKNYGNGKVEVLNKSGDIVLSCYNKKEISRKLKIGIERIYYALKNEIGYVRDYFFRYEGDLASPLEICKRAESTVYLLYKNEVLIDWDCKLKNLAQKYNLKSTSLTSTISKKRNNTYNFRAERVN